MQQSGREVGGWVDHALCLLRAPFPEKSVEKPLDQTNQERSLASLSSFMSRRRNTSGQDLRTEHARQQQASSVRTRRRAASLPLQSAQSQAVPYLTDHWVQTCFRLSQALL